MVGDIQVPTEYNRFLLIQGLEIFPECRVPFFDPVIKSTIKLENIMRLVDIILH